MKTDTYTIEIVELPGVEYPTWMPLPRIGEHISIGEYSLKVTCITYVIEDNGVNKVYIYTEEDY